MFSVAVPTSGDVAIIQEKQQRIKVCNISKKSKSGQQSNLPRSSHWLQTLSREPGEENREGPKDSRRPGLEGAGAHTGECVGAKPGTPS